MPQLPYSLAASPSPAPSKSPTSSRTPPTTNTPFPSPPSHSNPLAPPLYPPNSTSPSPFSFPLSLTTTTLLVSLRHHPFHVHTSLLTDVSSFFRAALSSQYGFQESRTNTITLEEESVATVTAFIRWVYAWGVDGRASEGDEEGRRGDIGLWDWEKIDGRVKATRKWKAECREATKKWRKECEKIRSRRQRMERRATEKRAAALSSGSSPSPAAETENDNNADNSENDENELMNRAAETEPEPELQLPRRPTPPTFTPLLRLYLFADKYDIPPLRNALCRRIVDVAVQANCVPEGEEVGLLWRGTMPRGLGGERRNPMRQAILDLWRGLNTRRMVERYEEEEDGDGEGEGEGKEGEEVMEGFWRELVGELLGAERNGKEKGGMEEGDEKGMMVLGRVKRPWGFYDE